MKEITIESAIVGFEGEESQMTKEGWYGKLKQPIQAITLGKNSTLDELLISHFPITGTAEEIMKRIRANAAAVIASVEFNNKPYTQEEYQSRVAEIEKY